MPFDHTNAKYKAVETLSEESLREIQARSPYWLNIRGDGGHVSLTVAERDALVQSLRAARAENKALREGFDEEGITLSERCCGYIKGELAAENTALREQLAQREQDWKARNILLLELGGRGELLAKEHVNPDALDGLVAVTNEFDRLRNVLIPKLESRLAHAATRMREACVDELNALLLEYEKEQQNLRATDGASVAYMNRAAILTTQRAIARLESLTLDQVGRVTNSVPEDEREVAEQIVTFIFEDYPDNDMNRGGATEHVAAIITRHFAPTTSPVPESFYRLVLTAIAKDEALECRCGNPPYLDGEPCPKCTAIQALDAAANSVPKDSVAEGIGGTSLCPICKKNEGEGVEDEWPKT